MNCIKRILLIIVSIFFLLNLAVSRDWKEIKESGYLIATARVSATTFNVNENGETNGFCWELIKEFADSHDLELRFVENSSFGNYFRKDGEFPRPQSLVEGEDYTPDLLDEVDVFAEILTYTPFRTNLMYMIPYIETIDMIYTHQDLKINSINGLSGKKVLTYRTIAFYDTLTNYLKRENMTYYETDYFLKVNKEHHIYQFTPLGEEKSHDDQIHLIVPTEVKPSGYALNSLDNITMVYQRYADASLADSLSLMVNIKKNPVLYNGIRPSIVLSSGLQKLSFGTAHKTKELNQKLDEFIEQSYQNGVMDRIMIKYTGMTYSEYQQMIQNQRVNAVIS